MKRYLRFLGPIVVLTILGLALWLLYWKVKDFDYDEFVGAMRAIPRTHLAAAVGLTVLNYLVLIGYDLLNIRYLGHPFPVRKIALGSLTSYMVSNTFGMLLGGTAVRYRLYSAWGLSFVEVAELIALLGLTFWIGVFALAGFLFVLAPLPIPDVVKPYAPFETAMPIGIAVLIFVAVYLLACALWRRPVRVGHREMRLPPLRISLCQILISSADITLAGAVLYVLLPPDLGVGFLWFLGVYLLGVVFSVITHVPGQFGVLDLIIMEFLGNTEPVGAALAAYRAVYTFFPLLIALGLLALHEIWLGKRAMGRLWTGRSSQGNVALPGQSMAVPTTSSPNSADAAERIPTAESPGASAEADN